MNSMKELEFAIFLSLNGQAEEAISFYQRVFEGRLLFKISNKEFKEQLNSAMKLPKGQENFISHSIVQIGALQLQIADNPIYEQMNFTQGNQVSFSILPQDLTTAKRLYEKAVQEEKVKVIQAPLENEFADFYAIIQDPFGTIIQLTKEIEVDPSKKGEPR